MNSFYDIDFAQLYKQHLIAYRYHDVTAEKWDKKAVRFAETFVEKENSYTRQFLDKMKIEPTDSVLDIGSGPGTLAILLARLCKQVYAFYIYLLNRLYQRGIQAELTFLQGETGGFQGETYQDLQNAVEFSLGTLTELERQKLQAFYQQKQQSQQKISHDQARWAFISWQV
ncbi:rRNA adenine N-6-methyltransferase family protein [Glaesserella parasuis]|uniref:rRNA adenine N-6-methyltransferase family protein n=1 Tax=Glaesserella parasuis TaxID=738 RepID=UPI0021BEE844|nr:rRNA adenine N-6-methyltransferase family protein [Glaesserella parasuis]MCT8742366.1 hypothetical protein [Glaesserella parasuis]MCT8743504.1 hypothetical protein [Glaesserella parasuis]MDE4015456.1 hypothetical protein [Glaesserella parasuis]MDG6295877.1 rRNA adenine N-6-methyltransferase family protein [Glaesserella parasuis]MDG6447551.1 rRNA adenine N-6-methyltransferase family protein [Glaesserella parasuis]